MNSRVIIEKLIKSIEEKKEDEITVALEHLVKNINDAAKDKQFYSLPFDQISKTLSMVDFKNKDEITEPIALLQTIIENTSEFHEKEAILLLNDIKVNNLPTLSIEDIIGILSRFTKSELLTKLCELYGKDIDAKEKDYKHTIEKLNSEIAKLKQEIDENKNKTKKATTLEPLMRYKFAPVTEKPNSFEVNVFDACKKGKLDSVQYHYEVLHTNEYAKYCLMTPYYGDFDGYTALHIASAFGHLDIVQYLCEVQDFNPEERDDVFCLAPIHVACMFEQLPIIRYFCEVQDVDPNIATSIGETPLHCASRVGSLPIVQYLCEIQNANVEARDFYRRTALHMACIHDQLPIVQYLCEIQKINTKTKSIFYNHQKETAYEVAKKLNKTDIINYLESIGVNE